MNSHQQTSSNKIVDILEVTQVFGLLAKTTFGPKGYYKAILVSGDNSSTIFSKNGGVIFKSVVVTHPVGSIIIRLCKDIHQQGDSTLLGVMMTGELVRQAVSLILFGLHPVLVHEGYMLAKSIIKDTLQKIAIRESDIFPLSTMCKQVCYSVLYSKIQPHLVPELTDLCLNAFYNANNDLDGTMEISMIPQPGGTTELFCGTIIPQGPRDISMPRFISNPKILFISFAIAPSQDSSTSLVFNSASDHKELVDRENAIISQKVKKIIALGVNVIISTNTISGAALQQMSNHQIFALRHVRDHEVKSLARSCNVPVLHDISNLSLDKIDLVVGKAVSLKVETVQHSTYTHIELGKQSRVRTLIIGSWADFRIYQNISALQQAISAIRHTLKDKFVLPGAGATEILLSKAIREYGEKESLPNPYFKQILKSFGKALDYIPISLAENANFSRADISVAISKIKKADHSKYYGLNMDKSELSIACIPDDLQIFDTYFPKWVACSSAIDTAGLLIRIDRIVQDSNLLNIQPNNKNDNNNNKNQKENEEASVKSLHREFRPTKIKDGSLARAQQQSTVRKQQQSNFFYSKEQSAIRRRAETLYKQGPQEQITQRKRMMQLSKKEKERVQREATDE